MKGEAARSKEGEKPLFFYSTAMKRRGKKAATLAVCREVCGSRKQLQLHYVDEGKTR